MQDVDRLVGPATGLSSEWYFERDMVTALEATLVQTQSEGGDRVEVPINGWNV